MKASAAPLDNLQSPTPSPAESPSPEPSPSPSSTEDPETQRIAWSDLSNFEYLTELQESKELLHLILTTSGGECVLDRTYKRSPFMGPCNFYDPPPADLRVVEAANAAIDLDRLERRGTLYVFVKQRIRPDGSVVRRLEVERLVCHKERLVGNLYGLVCERKWRVVDDLSEEQFSIASDLNEATLKRRVRGRVLEVQWMKKRKALFEIAPLSGYCLLQFRKAMTEVSWGTRHSDPLKREVASMYRRLQPD